LFVEIETKKAKMGVCNTISKNKKMFDSVSEVKAWWILKCFSCEADESQIE